MTYTSFAYGFTHFRDNVVLDEARRAKKIIRHPMIVAVTAEVSVDHVIYEFAEGRFHTGWWWCTFASNHLIRSWLREIFR